MLLFHLMSRMELVLRQKNYIATFEWNSKETQILLQFFCAFLGVLILIYITVRWIGEYRALQGIRVQKETDMEKRLMAEKELNQRLYEQNAVLEHQKTLLKEAVERAERANEESRKSAEAKTNFLSRMTHDIRTPLNGIIGLLRISERHPDDIELLRTNREKMMISANHLLSLINDMLQMSKLEDGNVVLAHEVINLEELSSDILTIIS
ncbi:sensor histidine kinase [Brotaphodocola sp.]|uniref:sensor histidine kinase n=1 Tax=Brotaphodocola sp. TaxID=3073577 RepID=UPI003D7DD2AF